MPWHHVSDDTYRTLVDELTRVARSATRAFRQAVSTHGVE